MSGPPPKAMPSALGLPAVSFRKLYTFASPLDTFLAVTGFVSAVGAGATLPLYAANFGGAIDSFNSPTAGIDDIVLQIRGFSLFFVYIAIITGGLSFLQVLCTSVATSNNIARMRAEYARALLRLDFAWYDTHRTNEAVSRLAESTISIGSGLNKVSTVANYTSSLLVGVGIGFRTSWKLTLVIMSCAPLFAIALGFVIAISINGEKRERSAYARAGGIADEVLSLLRAVSAFGGEAHEARRYTSYLAAARAAGIAQGRGIGLAVGVMVSTFYAMYGVACFAGAMFILDSRRDDPTCVLVPDPANGCFTGGQVVTTFVAVLLGALSFGQIGPNMGLVAAARAAAADVFGVIDARPIVDVEDDDASLHRGGGTSLASGGGVALRFTDVTFAYPSRPGEPVLHGLSLDLSPGERVGVVGTSGSGKSTLALLAMRAYDVGCGSGGDGASVLVDGVDVRKWHVKSLRALIGLVQQEPLLFGTSIHENIALGVADRPTSSVTRAEVEAAAAKANAHGFVAALPNGYETIAGASVSSTQLSGGQRQRICIARALIRSPKLLLLDEATSALDTKSERLVQAALDTMAVQSAATTLVIAHRLSTLTNMDRIAVLERGAVIEAGTHAELAHKEGGLFKEMLAGQTIEGTGGAHAVQQGGGSGGGNSGDDTAAVAAVEEGDEAVAAAAQAATKGDNATAMASATDAATPNEGTSRSRVLRRVWAMQRPDAHLFPLAILAAAGGGCIQPCLALVYGGAITVFFSNDSEYMQRMSLRYLGYFGLLALAVFSSIAVRQSSFAIIGERLIHRLRAQSFGGLVRLPASFFDVPSHSVGALTTRLSTDAQRVKGATGEALASAFEAAGAVLMGVAIAFAFSWRLALVLMCVYPLLIIGGIFEFKSYAGVEKLGNKKLEDASELLSESVSASRMVAAFGLQPRTAASYAEALRDVNKSTWRSILIVAFGQSFERFTLQCTYAVAFFAGGHFLQQGVITFNELINTFLAVTLSAEGLGRITASSPDVAKAANAAEQIFAIIDAGSASTIDPLSEAGVTHGATIGASGGVQIEFRNVSFAYPSRPDAPVLRDFSLCIEPGQYVGVVGQSGSGKSTLALLIGRFYDVDSGAVLVDGVDVREWNVRALRFVVGLVAQEPALFAEAVAYNIGYGCASTEKPEIGLGVQPKETGNDEAAASVDDSRGKKATLSAIDPAEPTKLPPVEKKKKKKDKDKEGAVAAVGPKVEYPKPPEGVIEAARSANAAEFIDAFPDGYATFCGTRGSQLSGGQKQRVAIARALLRAPPILLLDEATAALDSKSEGVVQAALDNIIEEGRTGKGGASGVRPPTTVCIAHRLSTLAGADRIVVLEKGLLVEDGNHEQLMSRPNGKYRALAMAQAQGE